MAFGERLRTIFKDYKVNVKQMCEEIDISYNTIQSILRRDTDVMSVSVSIPFKIATYLSMDLYKLIGDEAANYIESSRPVSLSLTAQRIGRIYDNLTSEGQTKLVEQAEFMETKYKKGALSANNGEKSRVG